MFGIRLSERVRSRLFSALLGLSVLAVVVAGAAGTKW